MANGDRGSSQLTGLIDTGADAILASNLLTVELGIDLAENEGESSTLSEWTSPGFDGTLIFSPADRA